MVMCHDQAVRKLVATEARRIYGNLNLVRVFQLFHKVTGPGVDSLGAAGVNAWKGSW